MMPFIQGLLFGMHLLILQNPGCMSLGASLLQGSHCFSDCNQDNGRGGDCSSSSRRYALHDDDDDATDDALHLGSPIWHVPADLTRDLGSMLLGVSLL